MKGFQVLKFLKSQLEGKKCKVDKISQANSTYCLTKDEQYNQEKCIGEIIKVSLVEQDLLVEFEVKGHILRERIPLTQEIIIEEPDWDCTLLVDKQTGLEYVASDCTKYLDGVWCWHHDDSNSKFMKDGEYYIKKEKQRVVDENYSDLTQIEEIYRNLEEQYLEEIDSKVQSELEKQKDYAKFLKLETILESDSGVFSIFISDIRYYIGKAKNITTPKVSDFVNTWAKSKNLPYSPEQLLGELESKFGIGLNEFVKLSKLHQKINCWKFDFYSKTVDPDYQIKLRDEANRIFKQQSRNSILDEIIK